MTVKDGTRRPSDETIAEHPETTGRMLALVQERLEEIRSAEQPVLKLDPEDVRRLCEAVGVGADKTEAFRVLIRRRLVRLRGRWRENRSAIRAPVYIEGLTEAGLRVLEDSGLEDERSLPDRLPERMSDERIEGESR